MTAPTAEMKADPNYRQCLDHGYVILRNHMGNDETIVESARVSYGAGTQKVSTNRGLIRYLMRHYHTTPFEMVEFRFLMKMPIFVARQKIRHRTANVNEESLRYSRPSDDFYIPAPEDCAPQSKDNKQGREGTLSEKEADGVRWLIDANNDHAYQTYQTLVGDYNEEPEKSIYDVYDEESGWFDEGYPGIARELARIVLPVNIYTQWYWKCDLHNILHMLKLRLDSHAQKEIRVYAEAVYDLIKPYVPLACEAFEDYMLKGGVYSRMEYEIMKIAMQNGLKDIGDLDEACKKTGMGPREIREFKAKWDL